MHVYYTNMTRKQILLSTLVAWAPMRWRSCSTSSTGPLWTCRLEPIPGTECEESTLKLRGSPRQNNLIRPLYLLSHSQVVLAADMLGLEGLKDVVEMVLTRDYCRFFPKVRQTEESGGHYLINYTLHFPVFHPDFKDQQEEVYLTCPV